MIAEIYIGKPRKDIKPRKIDAYLRYEDVQGMQEELKTIKGVKKVDPMRVVCDWGSWDVGYRIQGAFNAIEAFQSMFNNGYSIFHSKIIPNQIKH